MSVFVIALLAGIGVAGFVYSKLAHSSGNANPGQTLIGAAIAGILALVIIYTLFKFIFNF